MADLIYKQTVMNAFAEYVRRSNNSDFAPTPTWNDAVEIVENLPSVESVIHCKDCFFGHLRQEIINGYEDSWIECINQDGLNRDVSIDGYCSAGVRKESKNEG